jgi:hypothetical protein
MRCITCDSEFSRVRVDQKWDSYQCRNRWLKRERLGFPTSDAEFAAYLRDILHRKCPVCERVFDASRKQQHCCNNRCTVKARRRLQDGQPISNREWGIWKEAQVHPNGLKMCPQCGQNKPLDEDHFYRNKSSKGRGDPEGYFSWCRDCQNKKAMLRKRENRLRILQHYGGSPPVCACCGEAHYEFLCIDHIGGGGNQHRARIRSTSGANFQSWLLRNNFPDGFRVLCHNCNLAIGFYGYCPHHHTKEENATIS